MLEHIDFFRVFNAFIFSAVMAAVCFLIFLTTRKAYALTKHEGIKFFRKSFLYLALAFSARLVYEIFLNVIFHAEYSKIVAYLATFVLISLAYFSIISIFYLFFSVARSHFHLKNIEAIAHIFSLSCASFFLISKSHGLLILIEALFLCVGFVLIVYTRSKSKKTSKIHFMYLLIFLSWLINIWIMSTSLYIYNEIIILVEISTIGLYCYILYKVRKWLK